MLGANRVKVKGILAIAALATSAAYSQQSMFAGQDGVLSQLVDGAGMELSRLAVA